MPKLGSEGKIHVSIVKRKRPDGSRYVQEVRSVYDPKTKNSKTLSSKTLGILPPGETDLNKLIPSDNRPFMAVKRQVTQMSDAKNVVQDTRKQHLVVFPLEIIMVVILLAVSLFIIANTIKLATFNRREEIAIMKMCGATNWFVRAPFLVEGMILGLAGGLIAFFLQWAVYGLITKAMMEGGIFNIITTIPFGNISHVVLLAFLGAGFAIGAGGSVMAIRKFLKV